MFDGKPTVFLAIFQLPDANALETHDLSDGQDERAFVEDFPEGIAWEVGFDTTPYTRESINEVFQDAARRDHPGGHRGAGVFAELAIGDHSADRRAGGDRRHVRGDGGVRLQLE